MICIIFLSKRFENTHMKLRLLLILWIFLSLRTHATHIVGGELGLKHVRGNTYDLNMTLYFDVINGDPNALDTRVKLHIFRKRDDKFIRSYDLPLQSSELVNYTNPDCSIGDLVTRKIFYSRRLSLNPSTYSDAEGYYVIWERCCRNKIISNIVEPGGSGQTFYMEFPPLLRNGSRFFNSTPDLFPPLSDFACVNKPFYFDFSGKDVDGDSLVYYLSIPINGYSSQKDPAPSDPRPAPYSKIIWNKGHSISNMINGNPTLSINREGIVKVTPSETGLFVFAVTCDEYRDGVKIGSVVRDFQMLVVDCKLSTAPVATPILPDNSQTYNQIDTIEFRVSEKNKCFTIQVQDKDTGPITGRVVPIKGFEPGFLTKNSGYIQGANDVVELKACFPPCPPNTVKPIVYGMNVVVEDNNCAVPLQDTVRLFVKIIPDDNLPPQVTTSLGSFSTANKEYTITVSEGKLLDFSVFGDDSQGDTIKLNMQGLGFNPSVLGMTFGDLEGLPVLTDRFSWQVPCDLLEQGIDSVEYKLRFVASDQKTCGFSKTDTTFVRIIVKNDDQSNTIPTLLSDLKYDSLQKMYLDTIVAGETFSFQVLANDLDKDTLNLNLFPDGFDLATYNMIFPKKIRGLPLITATFSWKTDCKMLDQPETKKYFDFQAIVRDERLCNKSKSDTIKIRLLLLPRIEPNAPPFITIDLPSVDNRTKTYYDTVYIRGETRFTITANDVDLDSLQLMGYGTNFQFSDLGIEFKSITGIAPLQAEWYWKPSCEALNILDGQTQKTFEMVFRATDYNDCMYDTQDSVKVNVTVIFEPEPNQSPVLSSNLTKIDTSNYYTEVTAGDIVNFLIIGKDQNRDSVRIRAFGDGFDLSALGMNFQDTVGYTPLELPFEWKTNCAYLQGSSEPVDFDVMYVVEDFKNCGLSHKDTIYTKIRVKPLPNPHAPILDIPNLIFDQAKNAYIRNVKPNQSLSFTVNGTDADGDKIEMYAVGDGFDLADFQMNFTAQKGVASLSENFTWTPTCEMYAKRQEFKVKFYLRDDTPCKLDQSDTAIVNIKLTDFQRNDNFVPPNVITPNGDGKNDVFYIPNLPVDNCQDKFKHIEIYNRWGRKVFQSDDRNFQWKAKGFSNGAYFYKIQFQNSIYKGTLTILGSSVN